MLPSTPTVTNFVLGLDGPVVELFDRLLAARHDGAADDVDTGLGRLIVGRAEVDAVDLGHRLAADDADEDEVQALVVFAQEAGEIVRDRRHLEGERGAVRECEGVGLGLDCHGIYITWLLMCRLT